MRVRLRAFPAVYLTTRCKTHERVVAARIETNGGHGGATMTALSCEQGGMPGGISSCEDSWEVIISGPGDITITHP